MAAERDADPLVHVSRSYRWTVLAESNDEGDLETLALQLGEGFPLLLGGEMDENCWIVAKALGRNSMVVQGVVEHLAKTHFVGGECVPLSTGSPSIRRTVCV